MMNDMKYGILCFIPMVLGIIFWKQLPDTMALHFNLMGNVDGVTTRYVFVFGLPILGFLGHCIYMLLLIKRPSWIGRKGLGKYSVLFMPILTACIMTLLFINSK